MKPLDSFISFVWDEEASFSTFWIESCYIMAAGIRGLLSPVRFFGTHYPSCLVCRPVSGGLVSLCKKTVVIP